jgi:hypothetical protein
LRQAARLGFYLSYVRLTWATRDAFSHVQQTTQDPVIASSAESGVVLRVTITRRLVLRRAVVIALPLVARAGLVVVDHNKKAEASCMLLCLLLCVSLRLGQGKLKAHWRYVLEAGARGNPLA